MQTSIQQDVMIYPSQDGFTVIGQADHSVLHEAERASAAIEWAIDSLESGGELRLSRGEYQLDAPIRLVSNIRLVGSGRGTRLLVAGGDSAAVAIEGDSVKGVEIINIAIIDINGVAEGGVKLTTCGDCQVNDTYIKGFGNYGIWMREHCFLSRIQGCSIAGCKGVAIKLENLQEGPVGDYLPNTVSGCMIYGGGKGIECQNAIVVNLIGNSLYHCHGVGFHVHSYSNSVLITGCRTFQITGIAVLVDHSHEFNCSSNIFCWHTEEGIVIRDAAWGVISGNEVIDNGSHNHGGPNHAIKFAELEELPNFDAIRMEQSRGYSVTGNTIFNWGLAPAIKAGIREDERCYSNTIIANNVNYYKENELRALGRGSVTALNLGHMSPPHDVEDIDPMQMNCQSFQPQRTEKFISEGI
jgi:hypothetical protein